MSMTIKYPKIAPDFSEAPKGAWSQNSIKDYLYPLSFIWRDNSAFTLYSNVRNCLYDIKTNSSFLPLPLGWVTCGLRKQRSDQTLVYEGPLYSCAISVLSLLCLPGRPNSDKPHKRGLYIPSSFSK